MIFCLTIDTDNVAFVPEPAREVARCLRVVADRISEDGDMRVERPVMDYNGNQVGTYLLAGGPRPFDWETDAGGGVQ